VLQRFADDALFQRGQIGGDVRQFGRGAILHFRMLRPLKR
jgi:hypothetical protein